MKRRVLWYGFLVLGLLPAMWGQQAAAEETVYKDWALRCSENPAGCILEQRVYVEGAEKTPLVHMAVRKLAREEGKGASRGLWVVLRVPLEVRLAAGLKLRVDGAAPRSIPFHHCRAEGCLALFPLDSTFRRRLEAGREAMVTFETLGGQGIGVPVSLLGVKAGLAGLEKASGF